MRFEVRYPTGEPHEVELQGTFAVLGRDPTCDLVLNDVKCSRRHAVIEAGPDGLSIRDTESANGIFVNGQKVERAKLQERDLVRLGEIVLRVLPEQITGTVVMGPEDLVDIAPAAARPAPLPPKAPARRPLPPTAPLEPNTPSAPFRAARQPAPAKAPLSRPAAAAGPSGRPLPARPLTVTVLSVLWIASILLYGGGGAFLAVRGDLPSPFGLLAAVLGGLLAVVAAVMALGLWTLKPWARFLQIGIAVLGILDCPMALASATVLVYMLRKPTASWFSGRKPDGVGKDAAADIDRSAETTFALTVVATVALGVLATAGGLYFGLRRP